MGQISVLNLKIDSVLTALVDLTNTESVIRKQIGYQLNSGILKDEADEIFVETKTIGASAGDVIELVGANDTNAFKGALNFTNIKLIYVKCLDGNITVRANATTPFVSPWVTASEVGNVLNIGGVLVLIAPDLQGFDVVPATNDELEIENNSASLPATYEVLLIGVNG